MGVSKKAINFDLSINALKEYYSEISPQNAYKEIERFMTKHGFEHRQGSGYESVKPIRMQDSISLFIEISEKLEWLHLCVERFDITNVTKVHDLINFLNEPYKEVDEECDVIEQQNNEYRLINLQDGTYELRNIYDEVIGVSQYDNIEDALDEINQHDVDLEI